MNLASRPVLLGAVAALLALVPAAAHAAPAPFGHACVARDGVRFCPTSDLRARIPSFDGTPLDVDVTLPATGRGPFPTLALLHGIGGTKTSFEGTGGDPLYNNEYFARRGYAVLTPTVRGFGDSCGTVASRTAGCERGWTRLNDMRYEIRDVQHLLGVLVDEKVARPDALGATGVSYGGGASTMLAYLRDRIRRVDGSYAPWRSPRGTRLSLAAAWPRWLWTNGESIFTRNGRGAWSRSPVGVSVQAYAGAIFGVALSGFVAPRGSGVSADVRRWKSELDSGVLTGAKARQTLDNAYRFHGVAGVPGTPAPLLMQSGWTDALFPVPQALAAYDALRREHPRAAIAIQLGDLGHPPGANHPRDVAAFDRQGVRFLDSRLQGRGAKLAPGRVTTSTMTCPRSALAGGGPFTASSFSGLTRGRLVFGARSSLRITSAGADATLAAALNPLFVDLCTPRAPDRSSHATASVRSPGVTMIGLPLITGTVRTTGRSGQIAARLWDRDPVTGRQRLITRGVYGLRDRQSGTFRFELDGNAWRFARGHRIVLELLGRDAPTYRASRTRFRATLSRVRVSLPVRERQRARFTG